MRNAGRKDVLGNLLNKPIIVTPEQIDNLQVKVVEEDGAAVVMTLKDYFCAQVIDILQAMAGDE